MEGKPYLAKAISSSNGEATVRHSAFDGWLVAVPDPGTASLMDVRARLIPREPILGKGMGGGGYYWRSI